jgi:hypothetical protein
MVSGFTTNLTSFIGGLKRGKKKNGGGFSHSNTHIYKISKTPQKGMKLRNPKENKTPLQRKNWGREQAAPLMKLPELKRTR